MEYIPSISIIVPIYNVEKYLRQCLDSILSQTKTDIEIICVNDGSTDSCPQILAEYAKKDHRIRVIHQENGGLGKAYNMGLDHATGKYIGFVEPDDWIASNMYEELYKKIEKDSVDIVKCGVFCIANPPDILRTWPNISGGREIVSLENPFKDLKIYLSHVSHWAALYKSEFVIKNSIRFMETSGASLQDMTFWFQCVMYARNISATQIPLYYYRVHEGQTVYNMKAEYLIKVYNHWDVLLQNILLTDKSRFDDIVYIRFRRSLHDYLVFSSMLSFGDKFHLFRFASQDYKNIRYQKYVVHLPIKEKIWYMSIKYHFALLVYFINSIKIFIGGKLNNLS